MTGIEKSAEDHFVKKLISLKRLLDGVSLKGILKRIPLFLAGLKKKPSSCLDSHLPMTLSRLKTFNTSQLFFFFLFFFFGLSASVCLAGDTIAPDRNISMVQGEPGSPDWKILWDMARKFARDEDYSLAVKAYSDLIRIKPNIEEANWEYCKVLLKVEDFSTATKIIGGLLDKDPNNYDYLLAGGTVATHWKNYETAIRYFGRVFEKDPTGVSSDTALLGLATSLRNKGKKELAFSLLEQFSLRHPKNSTIIHYLALDAYDLGKDEKARKFYAILLKNKDVADLVILQAEQVFDVPGYEKNRSAIWLDYLRRHPDYMPFRAKAAKFSVESGEFEEALIHLKYMADNIEDNEEYLLEAGKVCQRDLNRPDRALYFYERYIQKHPENLEIKAKINNIQSDLANEFISIVENGGTLQLWGDLAEIALNRLAIYREMADLLEKRGKTEELIEVLTIIYKHSPHEDSMALRIAHQYYRKGQYSKTLEYLSSVTGDKSKTKSYFLFKGDTEQQFGLEMDSLASFEKGLSSDPLDVKLRIKCLELAGRIGNTDKLKSLFNTGLQHSDERVPVELVITYLDLLSFNYMFQEYEQINSWAEFYFAGLPETITRLALHKASSLRKEGKTRRAEQLLRQLLNNNIFVEDILFQLAENAVIDKNILAAESWYQALRKDTNQDDSNFSLDPQGCKILLLKVNMLKAEGKYGDAQALIDSYIGASEKKKVLDDLLPFLVRLQKQRCWLSFYKGKLLEAYQQCEDLLDNVAFDPELLVLHGILNRRLKTNDRENKDTNSKIYIAGNPVLTRLLTLAAKEIEYLEYDAAENHLSAVLGKYPHSVVGTTVWAELMVARGHSDIAAESLSQLIRQFPEELYYHEKLIEVEARRGRYKQGLALLKKEVGKVDNIEDLTIKLTSADDVEGLLTLARLLWGDKQQEKALLIYKQLLALPVFDILSEKFRQKQINYHYLTRENTFWNSMMLMLQSEPDVLAELMEPPFLIENRGNEAGEIVSGLFEKYSWQKLITNEYMARKSIFDRNYYYAEQSYKRLLEDDSSEGMSDLATIYGKIGKYRKEAQVYEAMQNSGATSPDLIESIERNTLQISPQSIFNVGYEERNGRDGHIDIARTSFGTSFWFTPDLDKDIRLIYTNNHFESLDTDKTTGSNFLYAVATYEITKAYELILGAGTEKLTSDSDTGFQYEIELKGQLDDYINGYVLLEKKQVYDTIAAIQQQITFQSIETGLSIETPMGLSFGGDLHHRYYNDGNSQNRFHGYSSYSIFGESSQLALRYEYQYLTNDDENSSLPEVSVEPSPGEPLYWSPSLFNEHRMALRFQHDFLGYELGKKKSMSYYAIDNAIGFEENEILSFTTKFDIFLEMSPHFLLKGNFTLSKSDEFEETGLSMSLHYRW